MKNFCKGMEQHFFLIFPMGFLLLSFLWPSPLKIPFSETCFLWVGVVISLVGVILEYVFSKNNWYHLVSQKKIWCILAILMTMAFSPLWVDANLGNWRMRVIRLVLTIFDFVLFDWGFFRKCKRYSCIENYKSQNFVLRRFMHCTTDGNLWEEMEKKYKIWFQLFSIATVFWLLFYDMVIEEMWDFAIFFVVWMTDGILIIFCRWVYIDNKE